MMNKCAISAKSKKRSVNASTLLSEMEASFWAARDLLGFVNVLNELGLVQKGNHVYTDNEGNKCVIEGRMSLGSTNKFADVRYLMMKEWHRVKRITVLTKRTWEMIADIFTKALGRLQFERLRDCLTGYADIGTLERSVRSDVNVLRRRLLRKKLSLLLKMHGKTE